MGAYERTSPGKIRLQREQIVKDMEDRENVPQSERLYPNLLEKGKRVLQKVVGKNPPKIIPPAVEGAKVIGTTQSNNIS